MYRNSEEGETQILPSWIGTVRREDTESTRLDRNSEERGHRVFQVE